MHNSSKKLTLKNCLIVLLSESLKSLKIQETFCKFKYSHKKETL